MDDRELLRRVVDYGTGELGVLIFAVPAASEHLAGSDARFLRRVNGAPARNVYIRRDNAESFASAHRTARFVAGAERPLLETLDIAHELGHAQLDQERGADADRQANQLETIEARLKASAPLAITVEQAQRFYDEELQAWENGRRLLEQLGFENWDAFSERRGANLRTYADGIVAGCPSWPSKS